jgi:hypothetical protein
MSGPMKEAREVAAIKEAAIREVAIGAMAIETIRIMMGLMMVALIETDEEGQEMTIMEGITS